MTCEGCGTTADVAWFHGGYVCPSCKADYQKWLIAKGKDDA